MLLLCDYMFLGVLSPLFCYPSPFGFGVRGLRTKKKVCPWWARTFYMAAKLEWEPDWDVVRYVDGRMRLRSPAARCLATNVG